MHTRKIIFIFLTLFSSALPLLKADQQEFYISNENKDELPIDRVPVYIETQKNANNETLTNEETYVEESPSHNENVTFEEWDLLPEFNPFFPTMLAQPHIIGYSAGYRSHDRVFKTECLPISIGDQFSIYQFKTVSYGHLFAGIEACVWAIFEARSKSLSLINTDYFVALPLTYINKRFSAKLRFFHESSHLGDEYLLENRTIVRLNPSKEAVDFSVAYDLIDRLTVFLGYSYVLRSDDSFKVRPNSVYYGFNYLIDYFKINSM